MIDLHCHILPGIDDGPADIEESLQIARLAVQDGIHTCVATPHFYVGLYTPSKETIQHQVSRLNEHLRTYDIALQVLPGMEVALTPEALSHFEEDKLLGLNGSRYLLVEPSRLSTPDTIHNACYQLLVQNAIPVLAHPERNPLLHKAPEILFDLVRSGVLLQINATSLDPSQSQRAYDNVRFLLQHRAVHCIASDGHSAEHRPPKLRQAVEEAGRILNSRNEALAMVTTTPERIISGLPMEAPEPLAPEPPQPGWKRFIPFMH